MKNERKSELKVGITTILSLVVFIIIMGWAKNFLLSSNDIDIKVIFDNVSGLEIDDDVTVRGLRKGFVKDIFLDQNIIHVTLSIDRSVDLRKDAVFQLATIDLMGDKKIEILPGYSNEKLDLTVLHTGEFIPDLSIMMSTIGEMKDDIQSIVKEVKTSLSSVNNFLTDEKINSDLRSSLRNISDLTSRLDLILSENQENISTITENTAEISSKTNTLLSDNESNISSAIARLSSILSKSDTLVSKLDYFVQETLDKNNNLGQFIYDDSLMLDLKDSVRRLHLLLDIMINQLQSDGIKVDAYIW